MSAGRIPGCFFLFIKAAQITRGFRLYFYENMSTVALIYKYNDLLYIHFIKNIPQSGKLLGSERDAFVHFGAIGRPLS